MNLRNTTGRRGVRGFSLIEVLAALTIFSFAIVALIDGLGMSLRHWRLAEEKTKALMLAENVMEEILYSGDLSPGEDEGQYEEPDDNYSWSSTIDETEVQGLYEVRVEVAWSATGEGLESGSGVTLTTLWADRNQSRLQFAAQQEGG